MQLNVNVKMCNVQGSEIINNDNVQSAIKGYPSALSICYIIKWK